MGGDDRTSVSARLRLKEGVIDSFDQSWSFGHHDALRLTRRPVGPVNPLCQVVQCVYLCTVNQRKVKVSITWEALPATLTHRPDRP